MTPERHPGGGHNSSGNTNYNPQQSIAMNPHDTRKTPPDGGHNSSGNTNYIPQQSVAMRPHDTRKTPRWST